MAKNNNLKDFLTDVADAIRSKTGDTGLINPQDFSARIASIQTGSGGGDTPAPSPTPTASKGDVTFYDYDGVVLHSYSKDAFLALTELPALPSRSGLVCQGWNWSFEDAIAYVSEYDILDVGATYITDDGKTRLYISVPRGRLSVSVCFSQTIANGVTIDWGDGSATQTLSGTGNKNTSHTYAKTGDYVISLDPVDGCTLGFGQGSSSYNIMGTSSNTTRASGNMLKKAEIGKNVTTINGYAFAYCYSLESVSIPQEVVTFYNYVFRECYSLSSIVIPRGVDAVKDSMFYSCCSLANVVIPDSVTSINNSAFYSCYSLSSIVIPNSVTSINNSVFYRCYSLASVVIPQSVTSVDSNVFYQCYSLASVVFDGAVTTIKDYAFYQCYCMAYCDLSQCTSVPTLGTNAYYSISSKIIVPDALYDEWKAATNWSSYASYIVKDSEFIR